jgi:Predicted hydrolases or acyltransferases (alpha/beta hydrolase superfamily)
MKKGMLYIMKDYTKSLPTHIEQYVGENDLYLEIFPGEEDSYETKKKPTLLFVHGAYTGSWMWSKYLPHFIEKGYTCYVMNLRSHYKSRVMDLSAITFEDYLSDIKEIIVECEETPVLIGFSLGGILCQKIAETIPLKGLILLDSCISKEVNEIVPYKNPDENPMGMILSAPIRDYESIDETKEDIDFQIKYLSMESAKAMEPVACWIRGNLGMSIDSSRISCPCLVIKAINSDKEDELRGQLMAKQFHADYMGLWNVTHTGLLVGQRYQEAVERILSWLEVSSK